MCCQRLWVLRTEELGIIRKANVDQAGNGALFHASLLRCGVERGVLDRVAIDLANVQVIADFLLMLRWDVVCGAPDLLLRWRYMLGFD